MALDETTLAVKAARNAKNQLQMESLYLAWLRVTKHYVAVINNWRGLSKSLSERVMISLYDEQFIYR